MKEQGICCVLVSGALLLAGCAMSGNYHSARIRDSGISEFGLTFGYNAYTPIDSASGTWRHDSAWSVPIAVPEITFGTAVARNWEVGGRASLQALGVEGYVKWGFLQGEKLCLALAPALGGHALPFGEGTVLLPLLLSYQITPRVGAHGSVFVAHSEIASSNNKDYEEWARRNLGASNVSGFSLGFEITGAKMIIRPMIEYAGVYPARPEEVLWRKHGRTSVLIHLGWILGTESQQLDRIEKKLDSGR